MKLNHWLPPVPGPCDPEDLIDGIIFAANYLGSTQLLSDKTPSKNIRMMQAQEAVSRIKVHTLSHCCTVHIVSPLLTTPPLLFFSLLCFVHHSLLVTAGLYISPHKRVQISVYENIIHSNDWLCSDGWVGKVHGFTNVGVFVHYVRARMWEKSLVLRCPMCGGSSKHTELLYSFH